MSELQIIAKIECDFPTKFGLPRQSGLVDLPAKVVFDKKYGVEEAFRGIEGYSHIWLIWSFSEVKDEEWRPMVRPPRLGGNKKMGVFSTRSPFRPNKLGLSCVKLVSVERVNGTTVLNVLGSDLMDGTPIYDVKPYLPHSDIRLDATGGFSGEVLDYALDVELGESEKEFTTQELVLLRQILAQDPRPSYVEDEDRVFGFEWAGREIKFTVQNNLLKVVKVEKLCEKKN